MITYIDLPLRGENVVTGHDVLVIAFYLPAHSGTSVGEPHLIYVNDDGRLGTAALADITINWRFDDRTRKWIDVDTGEDMEEDDGESQD